MAAQVLAFLVLNREMDRGLILSSVSEHDFLERYLRLIFCQI